MEVAIMQSGAQLYGDLGPLKALVFLFFLLACAALWHYFSKIYPRQLEMKQRHYDRTAEAHEKTNEILISSQVQLKDVKNSQERIYKYIDQSIKSVNLTLEKISDKIIESDEKLLLIEKTIDSQSTILSDISSTMITKDSIDRVHFRLDDIKKEMATKEEIKVMSNKLDKTSETVTEIKSKIFN